MCECDDGCVIGMMEERVGIGLVMCDGVCGVGEWVSEVRGALKFSLLFFASSGANREMMLSGGLCCMESFVGGGLMLRMSGGLNRYFGGGGLVSANRGKLEERATSASAFVIGGVLS